MAQKNSIKPKFFKLLGRTIEHIFCMSKQLSIVIEINTRPDTLDYYGNLPLFYTVHQDDLAMLDKQLTLGV